MENTQKRRNPWAFIPTQYFAEGLPFVLVNTLSVAMFKSLDESNIFISLTSFLYIPWTIKMFWGTFVDGYLTKRKWVLYMQIALAVCFGLISLTVNLPSSTVLVLWLFTMIAFLSATHDIATDGFYLHALEPGEQALFTGIRSTFYRFSMIFGSGLLVALAGYIGTSTGSVKTGWSVAFAISGGLFLLFFIYHKFALPHPVTDLAVKSQSSASVSYKEVFKEYFAQKRIAIILAYILLYRFGEGMLLKMAQPFFLDKPEAGGMGLKLTEVGIYYGTVGIVALVVGGILGGFLVKKYGLKKLIWPMAFAIHLPNILYIFLAWTRHDIPITFDFSGFISGFTLTFHPIIQSCIVVEQFGYGLGFTAFMVYLLYISKGRFKTSHYAISTGIMALGYMIPQFLSGFIQTYTGYFWLFVICSIVTVPGMLTIFFLPFDFGEKDEDKI